MDLTITTSADDTNTVTDIDPLLVLVKTMTVGTIKIWDNGIATPAVCTLK